MKRLSVLFAVVMMFMSFGAVNAQKVASLDVTTVLTMMPEYKKADEQLQALSKAKQAELEKQAQTFQADVKKYQEGAAKMTPQAREQKEQELQKTQQNIQQMAQMADKDLQEKKQKAMAPIEKKLMDVVDKVAKANGWDFIFDANTLGLIYKNGPDATPAVKKELGL